MIAKLALTAALALGAVTLARGNSVETEVNARLDAQLRQTLHRLATEAAASQVATAAGGKTAASASR